MSIAAYEDGFDTCEARGVPGFLSIVDGCAWLNEIGLAGQLKSPSRVGFNKCKHCKRLHAFASLNGSWRMQLVRPSA